MLERAGASTGGAKTHGHADGATRNVSAPRKDAPLLGAREASAARPGARRVKVPRVLYLGISRARGRYSVGYDGRATEERGKRKRADRRGKGATAACWLASFSASGCGSAPRGRGCLGGRRGQGRVDRRGARIELKVNPVGPSRLRGGANGALCFSLHDTINICPLKCSWNTKGAERARFLSSRGGSRAAGEKLPSERASRCRDGRARLIGRCRPLMDLDN